LFRPFFVRTLNVQKRAAGKKAVFDGETFQKGAQNEEIDT